MFKINNDTNKKPLRNRKTKLSLIASLRSNTQKSIYDQD